MSEYVDKVEFEMKDLLSILDKEIMQWLEKKNDKEFAHSTVITCSRVILKNAIANACLNINHKDKRKEFIQCIIQNLEAEIFDILEDHESNLKNKSEKLYESQY